MEMERKTVCREYLLTYIPKESSNILTLSNKPQETTGSAQLVTHEILEQ
jgi:hypothetical protein